jgi:hypothetical protein
MPELAPDGTLREIDLDSDTEHVRRKLYDRVVLMQFSPIEGAGPDEYAGPDYTADDARLKVFYAFGRWFATWTAMDERGLRTDQQQELVRLEADPSSRFGLMMHEV